ncbi:uncharacterized protein PG986_000901 [Apiospora aurea]|uniref:Uncharacterized protein n=1 Tax=Apiospora aurea TaxID=335848 RepID=A0ABR1QVD2_9PEZI
MKSPSPSPRLSSPYKRYDQEPPPGLSTPAVIGYCSAKEARAKATTAAAAAKLDPTATSVEPRIRRHRAREADTSPADVDGVVHLDLDCLLCWGNQAATTSDSDSVSSRSSFWSYLLPGIVRQRRGEDIFGGDLEGHLSLPTTRRNSGGVSE